MKRGDLVAVAVSGDYGKPRPALVVQAAAFDALPSVTVLLLTSHLRDVSRTRLTVQPDAANNLRVVSQIMIDRAVTVSRAKVGKVIGSVDAATMQAVNRALAAFLGLEGVP